MTLSAERLKEVIDYDPLTGEFRYRVSRGKFRAGATAGRIRPDGYRLIKIDYAGYQAGRIAWLYVYGRFPEHQIDHINLVRSDDRIANLREATPSQNGANRSRSIKNTSGFKGVIRCKNSDGWLAQAGTRTSRKHLGPFRTPEEASEAYMRESRRVFGDFARSA